MVLCSVLFFASAVGISAYRITAKYQSPGVNSVENQGLCDFHNGVYFPAKAFINGDSPYSVEYSKNYPVHRPLPFISPAALLAHAPIALLPLRAAEISYFSFSAVLCVAISYLIVREPLLSRQLGTENNSLIVAATFACAAFIFLSRGGQQTIFTGYFTFEIVLASLLAIGWGKDRPWLAAIALVVVSFKPNYVIPLGFLLLAQGKWKSVTMGGLLSLTGAMLAAWWIEPEQWLVGLFKDVQLSQEIHLAEEWEKPVNNWVRVDFAALVSKWMQWNPNEAVQMAWMFAFVVPASILIRIHHRREMSRDCGIHSVSGAMLLLIPLVAIYHQAYDAILALPIAASAWFSRSDEWQAVYPWKRILIAACILLPAVNYLSSQLVISRLGLEGVSFQVATSLNAIALLFASGLLTWHLARTINSPAKSSSRP